MKISDRNESGSFSIPRPPKPDDEWKIDIERMPKDRLIREEARSLVDLQQSNPFEQNGLGIKKEVSMDGIRGDLKEIIRLLGKIETKLPEKDVGKIAAGMAKEINHVLQSRVDKTDSKKA